MIKVELENRIIMLEKQDFSIVVSIHNDLAGV